MLLVLTMREAVKALAVLTLGVAEQVHSVSRVLHDGIDDLPEAQDLLPEGL